MSLAARRGIWGARSGKSGVATRSLVETKMNCFKLLADHVHSRDFDRQVAELQTCAEILNRFTTLGTPQTVRIGSVRLGIGAVRPAAELRRTYYVLFL